MAELRMLLADYRSTNPTLKLVQTQALIRDQQLVEVAVEMWGPPGGQPIRALLWLPPTPALRVNVVISIMGYEWVVRQVWPAAGRQLSPDAHAHAHAQQTDPAGNPRGSGYNPPAREGSTNASTTQSTTASHWRDGIGAPAGQSD